MSIPRSAQLLFEARQCGLFLVGCFEKSLERKVFVRSFSHRMKRERI